MNPKETLVNIIATDPRIRNYNKDPSVDNLQKAVTAYEEAIKEFCKKYDELVLSNK